MKCKFISCCHWYICKQTNKKYWKVEIEPSTQKLKTQRQTTHWKKKILEYIIDSMLDKKYKSQIEKSQNYTMCYFG